MLEKIKKLFSFQEPTKIISMYPRAVTLNVHEIGSYGTEIYSGYIQEEYLLSLTGQQRADEFDKMKRSDYQAKMCLNAVKNPIRSAKWEIEAASDDVEHQKQAQLIKHILFSDMRPTWRRYLSEFLTVYEHGHSLFEITHKPVLNHPEFGSYVGINKIAFRSQRTLERWNVDPQTQDLISVTQYAYGDLHRQVDIPAEFLILFTIDQEGANFEGISMLRACYGNWFRKNVYLKLNAIGIEKHAVPTPTVTIPEGKQNSDQYTNLITALEKYVQHHANYLTIPEGWTLDLKSNTYDPQKVEVSIDNEDKRMTKAFLANFLELGMNSVGSYSLSNDLSDFFLSGLTYVADEFCEKNNLIIKDLVDKNFGPQTKYPVLKYSGISDKAGDELAKILDSLVSKKVVIPDDKLETNIRKRYNLPEASLDGQRSIDPKPAFGPIGLSERLRRKVKSWE